MPKIIWPLRITFQHRHPLNKQDERGQSVRAAASNGWLPIAGRATTIHIRFEVSFPARPQVCEYIMFLDRSH